MAVKCGDISKFIITEDKTVFQVMKLLDQSVQKILFVQCDNKLLASVTDGDIRRWILKGGALDVSIKLAANYHPIYLSEDEMNLADQVMKENAVDAIPLTDKDGKIKNIVFLYGQYGKRKLFEQSIPVVIMAGGVGSRLLPYTQILPKPLIPIGDLPISEHIINQFRKYGCNDFRMIVNYKGNMIKAYFNEIKKDYTLTYITEEKALGTGGGLSLLKGTIGSTFILTNCDILINDDLSEAYRQHKKMGNVITIICPLKRFTVPYGVIHIGQNGAVESIQEKPSMEFYVNTGCYFIEPEVIYVLDYNEPIDFPDVIKKCLSKGERVGIYPIDESAWLDMGQINELEKMKQKLEERSVY